MRAAGLGILLLSPVFATLDCGKSSGGSSLCTSTLTLAGEPVTDAMLALPVEAKLEDLALPVKSDGCDLGGEYSEVSRSAKLGPFAAHYTATNYKGQIITGGQSLTLAIPACSGRDVSVTMADRSAVQLRHDPATGLYIVSGLMLPSDVTLRVTMGAVR